MGTDPASITASRRQGNPLPLLHTLPHPPAGRKGVAAKELTPINPAIRWQGNPLPLLHTLLICPHTMAGI